MINKIIIIKLINIIILKMKNKIEKKTNEIMQLNEEMKNLKNIILNKKNEIKNFHEKFNNIFIKNKLYKYIKLNNENENLLEKYYKINENIIENNIKEKTLLKYKNFFEKKSFLKKLKKPIKLLKEKYKKIKNKINKFEIFFEKNENLIQYQELNYICNPNNIILEKYNELNLQIELMKKFDLKKNEAHKNILIYKENIVKYNKELEELLIENKLNKNSFNKSKNEKDNNSVDESNISTSTVGEIDETLSNYNLNSPKFLKKVIKNSKINYKINHKLNIQEIFYKKNAPLNNLLLNNKNSNNNINIIINENNNKINNKTNHNIIIKNKKSNNDFINNHLNNNIKEQFNINDKIKIENEFENTNKDIIKIKEKLKYSFDKQLILIKQKNNIKKEIINKEKLIFCLKKNIENIIKEMKEDNNNTNTNINTEKSTGKNSINKIYNFNENEEDSGIFNYNSIRQYN